LGVRSACHANRKGATVPDLAMSLLALGRKLEAVQVLSERVAMTPNDAAWLARLGGALADVERHEEAVQAFERALAFPGAPPDSLVYSV